jgi:hypothetical protein
MLVAIGTVLVRVVIRVKSRASGICERQERRGMYEQIRTRTRHWSMLRYWLLVFSLESKLEYKLVVSLSCRLGIARDTKVSTTTKHLNQWSLATCPRWQNRIHLHMTNYAPILHFTLKLLLRRECKKKWPNFIVPMSTLSRNSTVGTATGHWLNGREAGVGVPVWAKFSFDSRPHRPKSEDRHSPTTNAEVKHMWMYTSTLPYAPMYILVFK